GPVKTFFLAFLLFVLVRGIADTERFDLSLPLWAIVMISLLVEHAPVTEDDATAESLARQAGAVYLDILPQTGKS
ncbi:MAG: hypothetical protein WCD77_00975, partial [Acidobacteriaceae bacterium]